MRLFMLRNCLTKSRSFSSTTQRKLLEGKVAVVTGGSNGIGAATVKLFASNGARVIVADINDEPGNKLEKELNRTVCRYVHCDVRKEDDVARAVKCAVTEFGRLDVMYNNAGVMTGPSPSPSISTMAACELDHVYSVNVRGAAFGVKHASRVMIEQGIKGSILCTASVTSTIAGLALHPYTISKHALVGLVKSSASELSHFGIRVNCITPHIVSTELMFSVGKFLRFKENCTTVNHDELQRMLSPEEIAKAALFLASEDSKYISGHSLVVDGSFSSAPGMNIFKGMQKGEIEFCS